MFERPEAFPVYRFELRIPETTRPVSVPTDVIFGWAAWVTTSAPPGIGPTTFEPAIFESPEAFPVYRFEFMTPETTRPVSVPTDVMFGWAANVTLRDVGTVETFEPFTFEIAEPFEAMSNPWIASPVSVPTDVMFGWEGWDTTRATFAEATFPMRFEEFRFEIADPFEAMSKPWTLRPVSVPTDVMFGWEAVITLRDVGTVETFEPFTFEIPEPLEAMSNPETVSPVSVPTDVILGWDAWDTTRATLAFATFPTRFEEFMFEIPDPFETMSKP